MLRASALLLFIFASLKLSAQSNDEVRAPSSIFLHQPMAEATVTIINAEDSSLVTFSPTDQHGALILRGLATGNYRLLITHVPYSNFIFHFNISNATT